MKAITVTASKKIDGKYVEQGKYNITVPLLDDCAAQIVGAKVTGEEEDLPVYDNDIANFVQSALLAYVKAAARNKLQPGTAEVKPGLKIATNWEELCAEGDRGGNGAALALNREVKDAFAKWASTLGKSEATVRVMVTYFSNKAALETASADHKAKLSDYVDQFGASLEEETLARYSRPLENVSAACAVATPTAEDF
jgi:hypothetical protein